MGGALTEGISVHKRGNTRMLSLPQVRTQGEGSHQHARRRVLTRNRVSQHLDLGPPNRQNCEKIHTSVVLAPSLQYFIMEA